MTNLFLNPYWHCNVISNPVELDDEMPNFNIKINSIKNPFYSYVLFVWTEKKYNEDFVVKCEINKKQLEVIKNTKKIKNIEKIIQPFSDFLNKMKPSLYQLHMKIDKNKVMNPILLKYMLHLYPFDPESMCSFKYAGNKIFNFLREDVMHDHFIEAQSFCFQNKIKQKELFLSYCKDLHPYRYCNFYDENKTKDFELFIERSLRQFFEI